MALQTTRVRSLRPFYFERKLINRDQVIELPRVFALEMCAANKAEIAAVAVVPPAPQPADKTDSKRATSTTTIKGDSHAG